MKQKLFTAISALVLILALIGLMEYHSRPAEDETEPAETVAVTPAPDPTPIVITIGDLDGMEDLDDLYVAIPIEGMPE